MQLNKLTKALEAFKEIDPDITLPSMLSLLYYAERDNQSGNQSYVEHKLDMSSATTSRATSHWAKWKRPRVEGHDFIDSIPDPEDRRYRIVSLTRKGLNFINKLEEIENGISKRK